MLISALLIFSGCFAGFGPKEGETGLAVIVEPGTLAKNFEPPVTTCDSYDITVENSVPTVVISETITGNKTYTGLAPDVYTVSVVGKGGGLALGEGSNTVEVFGGSVADCIVVVAEYDDGYDGDVSIDVSWSPAGAVINPVIESTWNFKNSGPADISSSWVLDTDAADLDLVDQPVGWAALVFKLFDGEVSEASAGFCTLVRVMADQITTGTVDLVANALSGGFQVLIDLQLYDPLTLVPDISEGEIMTWGGADDTVITVSGADVYVWYVNGSPVDSDDSFTVTETDYGEGSYRLDLIGWSSSGDHAGQLTWTIVKYEYISFDIAGSFNMPTGNWYVKILPEPGSYAVVEAQELFSNVTGLTEFLFEDLPEGDYSLSLIHI